MSDDNAASSEICWRIVNKEGDVFRRPQEGWGKLRVYIPVTGMIPKGKYFHRIFLQALSGKNLMKCKLQNCSQTILYITLNRPFSFP